MNSISFINNILGIERSEKLVAIVVSDLVDKLDQPLDDDGYAKMLDEVVNSNPGVRALVVIDEDCMVELTARLVVELEWQARNGLDNAAAVRGLANYLADWLAEKETEDFYPDEEDELGEEDEE